MQYVLFDMRCYVARHAKQVNYYISEFSAVLLDNELHTISTFQFVNEKEYSYSKGQLHIQGEDKLCVSSFENGWKKFRGWLPDNGIFVLWDSSALNTIEHCNKSGVGSYIKHNTLELKTLYDKMTTGIKRTYDISLANALVELDLTCDMDAMKHSTYRAQALVRLFRKMKSTGTKVAGILFMQNVCAKDYCYIVGKAYFPELQEKMRRKKNVQIYGCMKEMGVECRIVQSVVKMNTEHAEWAFSLKETGTELTYFTHRYYKGARKTRLTWNKDTTLQEQLTMVVDTIKAIEKELQYGVGNEQIAELVEYLCGG